MAQIMLAACVIVAVVACAASLAAQILVLVHAFRNKIWKGVLALLVPFYIYYYAIWEFKSKYKAAVLAALAATKMSPILASGTASFWAFNACSSSVWVMASCLTKISPIGPLFFSKITCFKAAIFGPISKYSPFS